MIRDSVVAEVQVAVRAASEEMTTELRAAAGELRHLRLSSIQTCVDRAESSISDSVAEAAAAVRNSIPSVCGASTVIGLSPLNTRRSFEDRGVGTDMCDGFSLPPDTPRFNPGNMHFGVDSMSPTSCKTSRSPAKECSGAHSSTPASLPLPIKAGRVSDVVSNLEMQCRRNKTHVARPVVGRSNTAAPEMALPPGDLAGVDMGQAVASNPAPDMQLLDFSLAADPVPSHNHDLMDCDQSWTQPTNTVAAASENTPRQDSPPVSSCCVAAPPPGDVASG